MRRPARTFGVAFLDPPYGQHLAEQTLVALREGQWLTSEALVVIEESLDADVEIPAGFRLLETRGYGTTKIMFVRAGH